MKNSKVFGREDRKGWSEGDLFKIPFLKYQFFYSYYFYLRWRTMEGCYIAVLSHQVVKKQFVMEKRFGFFSFLLVVCVIHATLKKKNNRCLKKKDTFVFVLHRKRQDHTNFLCFLMMLCCILSLL